MSFDTPILFLIFNRPYNTAAVFQRIRQIKPTSLYVVADGPRAERAGEDILCQKARTLIVEGIDWKCKLVTLFREKNLGCGASVSDGITWFFSQVEDGIILEDDTLPDISFFSFCEKLLARHRMNPKVLMISGDNFHPMATWANANSYSYTRFPHVWGWATWRRAWNLYDYKMTAWPEFRKNGLLNRTFRHHYERDYWQKVFDSTYDGHEDTWDYQWYFTCWKSNSLSIEPNVNLVKNIGFGEDATHTKESADILVFGNQDVKSIDVESHPAQVENNLLADEETFIIRYLNGNKPAQALTQNSPQPTTMKSLVYKIRNRVFPGISFSYLAFKIKKAFTGASLPVNADNKVYVHLGCGDIDWPKFINVDARPQKHVHYVHGVTSLPFFKNDTADLIYLSHCLEHIPFAETYLALSEWKRVLKPGGILRISVPDFEQIVKIYEENDRDMNLILMPLMGGQDYAYNFHYNMFNYRRLKELLIETGFSEVRPWEYGTDEFKSLPDWSGKSITYNNKPYFISLNVEAVK